MSDNPFASGANPFQSPMAAESSSDYGDSAPDLDGAAHMLRQTKPWVRFISVLMFIGSAIIVIFGLFVMAAGAPGMPGRFGTIAGVFYIVMALLYIMPAVFLWAYADRIGFFLRQRSPGTLTSALESQKSFWKFVGVVASIFLCLYAGVIVLVVITTAGPF